MKTILITGISGFVGGHYTRYLLDQKNGYNVHGISRSKPAWDFIPGKDAVLSSITFHQCDLLDTKKTQSIVEEIHPDYILHLASFSSVAQSWKSPAATFVNNTTAFLNIVEAVRLQNLSTRILSVGSSEEYGIVQPRDLPLKEDRVLDPENPYAVARVSEEYLARLYVKGYNIDICRTRSFNHIGPGQSDQFVVSSIARQFAEIEKYHKKPVIKIGNGTVVRDFTDVSDVVRAYDAILQTGINGEVYNVCSGVGYSVMEIINALSELIHTPIKVEQNQQLFRPIDNPILIGSYDKLFKTTGWKPTYSLKTSLEKIFTYWLDKLE